MAHTVTFIPGDGVGPEIMAVARRVLEASGALLAWEEVRAGEAVIAEFGTPLPPGVLDSIRKNRVALKGPLTTPVGRGFRSVNVTLRQELELYANVRPARNLPGVRSRYENVDLIVVRENTEDLYAGIEHWCGRDAAESIKLITRPASERIVRFAFELARRERRRKVTAVHKANIMKFTDGLFLECARKVAESYPDLTYEEWIVDAMAMKLVQAPENFDVLVMPNLYGDILSDLCAGLVGGLGVAPGANIGEETSVFEPVHGSAPKYAGQNKVNPLAAVLSGVMLLRHLGEAEAAARVVNGVLAVLEQGDALTYDLGGSAGTAEMGAAIVRAVEKKG